MAPPTPGPITPSPSNPQPEKFNYLVNMIVPIPKSLNIPKVGSGETPNAYGIIESLDDTGANVIALGDKHHLTTETLDNLRKEYPVGSAPWMGPAIMWKVANMQQLTVDSYTTLGSGGISTFDTTRPELRNLQDYTSGKKVDWTGFTFNRSYLIIIDNFLLWHIGRHFAEFLTQPSEIEAEYNFTFAKPFLPGEVGSVVGVPKGIKGYTQTGVSFTEADYSAPYTLLGLVVEKDKSSGYSKVVVDGHNNYWFKDSELGILRRDNQPEINSKYGTIIGENSMHEPDAIHLHLNALTRDLPITTWYTNGSANKEVYPNVNINKDTIVYGMYNSPNSATRQVGLLILHQNKLIYGEISIPEGEDIIG